MGMRDSRCTHLIDVSESDCELPRLARSCACRPSRRWRSFLRAVGMPTGYIQGIYSFRRLAGHLRNNYFFLRADALFDALSGPVSCFAPPLVVGSSEGVWVRLRRGATRMQGSRGVYLNVRASQSRSFLQKLLFPPPRCLRSVPSVLGRWRVKSAE